jgi:hypothetical protein
MFKRSMSVGLVIASILLMSVAFASPVPVDSPSMVASYEVSVDKDSNIAAFNVADLSTHVAYTAKQLPDKPKSTVVYTDGLFNPSTHSDTGSFINAKHTEEVGWRTYQLV